MHLVQPLLLAVLALGSATGTSATFGHSKFNWGVSIDIRQKATSWLKQECSRPGSFFTQRGGDLLCCSDVNRTPPPKNDDCPFNWSWHKTAKCCIPPREVCERDCGEGYKFNKLKLKCEREEVNKCGKNQWWWKRKGECHDFDWGKDKGQCPKGKKCPKGWSWSKKWGKCKPDTPRAPEPDCPDWRDKECWCGPPPGPEPSKKSHGGGCKHKRDAAHRRSTQILFPQTEMDRQYCPGSLHACTITTPTATASNATTPATTETETEWAFYECIDPATELESCGGCLSTGAGADCSKIEHALGVGCEVGKCTVYSCEAGFRAEGDRCVEA